jgi:hypothetical protein
LKVSSIPKGVEIALDRGRIVDVSGMSENSSLDGFGRDAAIAVNLYFDNHVLLPVRPGAEQEKSQEKTEKRTSANFTTLYK